MIDMHIQGLKGKKEKEKVRNIKNTSNAYTRPADSTSSDFPDFCSRQEQKNDKHVQR